MSQILYLSLRLVELCNVFSVCPLLVQFVYKKLQIL